MPVYDYQCKKCNSKYDIFHKGHEIKDEVICPSCGSNQHKKLMSVPVVSMGASSRPGSSNIPSCETGGCCGSACGVN
jgi:putative FmdB family regulatory protein